MTSIIVELILLLFGSFWTSFSSVSPILQSSRTTSKTRDRRWWVRYCYFAPASYLLTYWQTRTWRWLITCGFSASSQSRTSSKPSYSIEHSSLFSVGDNIHFLREEIVDEQDLLRNHMATMSSRVTQRGVMRAVVAFKGLLHRSRSRRLSARRSRLLSQQSQMRSRSRRLSESNQVSVPVDVERIPLRSADSLAHQDH